jgi:CheY-like chemotaxis protein/MinD-like ATPase involved in chromosome partitioning or flagellar assembly
MAGEKILIVDDEFDTLRLVGLMLERQGYKIVAAENGQQALEEVSKEIPDLILLDVMMPGMDGIEVAQYLRANPETEDVPIIMFTAKSQVEDKVTGLEAGADVYLTKPTQPRELFAQVKVLLARSQKSMTRPLSREAIRGRMIGIMAGKGGLGVSSLAVNLGIVLKNVSNRDVLVVDFNPGRGDISRSLGYSNPAGIEQLLSKAPGDITSANIEHILVSHESGIRLLLASPRPLDAINILRPEHYKAIAKQLPYLSQWALLDLGSSLLPATQSLAKMCDEIIIVVEPTPSNVAQTKALMRDLYSMGIGEPRLRIVLINRIRSSVQLNWKQVEEDLGQKIATVFTPAPELAFQAAVSNTPMVLHQSGNVTAQQFEKLANTIVKPVTHDSSIT